MRAKSKGVLACEADEQAALFGWARSMERYHPGLGMMFSTLNGVKLSIGQARKLKAQGHRRGIPDVWLPVPGRHGHHGLVIELKVGRNTPTPEQEDYIDQLNKYGYMARICRGWIEAAGLIAAYLGLPRECVPNKKQEKGEGEK